MPVAHDLTRTGTEFVHTAPQAQHDRPNRYHCGDRRTRCESASAFGGGYPRRVRGVVVLTAIAAALTGCGSGATEHAPIVFGITGGNMVPYRVSIQPNGSVRVTGSGLASRRHVTPARVRNLQREIQQAHLASRSSFFDQAQQWRGARIDWVPAMSEAADDLAVLLSILRERRLDRRFEV